MSNFAFLPEQFRGIADSARKAEGHAVGDPRAACFYSRLTLEAVVHWLYQHDGSLTRPYENSLGALLHEPTFKNLLPQAVFQKARLIQQMGNHAVHERQRVPQQAALQMVKELHHICYWLVRSYAPSAPRDGAAWRDDRVPQPISEAVVPQTELQALQTRLARQHQAALAQSEEERDALSAKLLQLEEALAVYRATEQPDEHDYNEAATRKYLIDVDLYRAGWPLDQERDREYEVTGMPSNSGIGYADYVLWGDDGKPLAVVEAKKATADPAVGQQQAKLYADCLEAMHGQRPIIFYTNGYDAQIWDDTAYPPRRAAGFYKKDELARLILRRSQRQALDVATLKPEIVDRYYQKRAIGSIFAQFASQQRKALLVMATGTGKTRTAIALVDALQRAGWVKRALFLADRVSLVRQAANAFKAHLPDSSPVNLVTDKNTEGRVYVCTYPTMMGLIDSNSDGEARFGVGHFDLVIIDEAHRSVYQKYGAIFRYFDSLLVGLTATPREQVDKNTYNLFDLEPGVPTDAYELETAVNDGFLVPPKVQQVDLRFPREGIDYYELSEEEREQWETLDWGDDEEEVEVPEKVNASAINNWLFNKDTVDKVLQHLMEHGHRVAGGDRLAKTIVFARNHDHAAFIEERFNHHYPHYNGHFARVIDNKAKYAQSLIDDFSQVEKAPHIAISVDMLDTGIDVPEAANLVFFKPVFSKIKFWQMIGRGTRLCPDLYGPGEDKADFRIFDFCFNFDFFRENPDGIDAKGSAPLSTRLFRARLQLLGHLQRGDESAAPQQLRSSLGDTLHGEVAAMNTDNFVVRMHLEAVERFQQREAWNALDDSAHNALHDEVSTLPSELDADKIEARMFDLTALRMQLAQTECAPSSFEKSRRRVMEIAMMLEDKGAIPAVASQMAYLRSLQESSFWEGITLELLEDMRLRMRGLVQFLDKSSRTIVYTDFQDEIIGTREEEVLHIPKMTSLQYERKVAAYLQDHLSNIVIHRLRTNQPLTPSDLEGLEHTLIKIGEDDGETLLSSLLERSEAPSLVHFVRCMVGLDRAAAQAAFSQFLQDRSLSPPQIRFIELIIDQLTARGVMSAAALYEPPFTSLHSGGPDALFAGRDAVVTSIFEALKATQELPAQVG